jgi:hypothetical protein
VWRLFARCPAALTMLRKHRAVRPARPITRPISSSATSSSTYDAAFVLRLLDENSIRRSHQVLGQMFHQHANVTGHLRPHGLKP